MIILVLLFVATSLTYVAADAGTCLSTNCFQENNCRCASTTVPLPVADRPQLISLTFNEAIVDNLYTDVWQPLLFGRTNPDGSPIGGTFFVPHEYTNYSRVQDLWVAGFEIGVNSVTNNVLAEYWSHATEQTIAAEFGDQKKIISTWANIPIEDLIGARTPQLQIEGDFTVDGYIEAGIQYDNSWTSRSTERLFPYTLDYLSTQECRTGTICPTESHPGFWVLPVNNIQGYNHFECNALTACNFEGTAQEIANWLMGEVNNYRTTNKAPLSIIVSSSWFRFTDNSFAGFQIFLDNLKNYDDIFLVSQKQIYEWIKSPVPLSEFSTEVFDDRESDCLSLNCELVDQNNNYRYMASCLPCPDSYPWLNNPFGN